MKTRHSHRHAHRQQSQWNYYYSFVYINAKCIWKKNEFECVLCVWFCLFINDVFLLRKRVIQNYHIRILPTTMNIISYISTCIFLNLYEIVFINMILQTNKNLLFYMYNIFAFCFLFISVDFLSLDM